MRATFPGVFRFPEERVFVERDGQLAGWGSEFVVARILSRDGSPERPIVFCPEEEKFYAYDAASGLYAGIDTAQVQGRVVELLEECAKGTMSGRRGEVLNLRTAPVLSRVPGALKSESRVSVADFEPTAGVIAVENGLLDLATGQLREYTPFRPVRTKLPIRWDPAAAEPARFLEYLDGMLRDTADRSLLIDCLAMAMMGNPFQRILLLLGAGGAGKTTLIKLLTSLVGIGDTGEFRPDYAGDKFERSAWIGKRLLYLPEAKDDSLLKGAAELKAISGQDPMVAEFKASNSRIPFVPRALPLITGNSDLRLRISEDRDAWKRRLVVLRVDMPAARNSMPGFAEHLIREEGSGILRVVVEAARRLLAEGMPVLTDEQNQRVDRLLNASDPFREFVQLHVVQKRGGKLYTGQAYEAARAFLRRNHQEVPGEQKLQQAVQAAMKQELPKVRLSKSLPRRADMSARGWRGVRLREPHELLEA